MAKSVPLLASVVVAAFCCLPALAQDAVPGEILQRTLCVKVGDGQGTAFQIDYKGKLYLVTARHVVAGLPTTGATIQIRKSDKWTNFKTVRTLFPASGDVDIAVLETDQMVAQPFQIAPPNAAAGEGPTFGQPVWFIGYPWGLGTHLANMQLPFIKKGTMSAVDASDPHAVVVYIDGFNNPGFSGGPILYWDFRSHAYRILGVVQGYRNDTAKALVNGQQVDTNVLVNSGILIGYDIKHAIEAIDPSKKP
jgi:hypothetical protein